LNKPSFKVALCIVIQPYQNKMARYTIQHWSQSEQEGGFWLLSVTIEACQNNSTKNSPPPSEFDFGCQFCINDSTTSLALFQQTRPESSIILQFLSDQALSNQMEPHTLKITPPIPSNQAIIKTCQTAKNVVLLGSEITIANVFYLAKIRHSANQTGQTVALLHCENHFPFRIKPALRMAPTLPPEAIGTSTLLEDWQIPNRLTSQSDLPGCFDGTLDKFFAYWLAKQNSHNPEPWHIIICASKETQKKCLAVSHSYDWVHCLGTQQSTND